MELWIAPLFSMNNLKIGKTERAVDHSPFLKKIATYQSVCVCVSEWKVKFLFISYNLYFCDWKLKFFNQTENYFLSFILKLTININASSEFFLRKNFNFYKQNYCKDFKKL